MSYEAFYDESGALHLFPDRNSPPGRRTRTGRRRGRRRREIVIRHQPEPDYRPAGPYPPRVPYYGQPMPMPVPPSPPATLIQSMDMKTALDALGTLLPAAGQIISAFRDAPEQPTLTGQPEKDIAMLLEFVAESFEHSRSGAQTASIMATTGAVMEILASL